MPPQDNFLPLSDKHCSTFVRSCPVSSCYYSRIQQKAVISPPVQIGLAL